MPFPTFPETVAITHPYLVTLTFETWGLVVRTQRTPQTNVSRMFAGDAIPWKKKLTSSIYGMDSVPAVSYHATRDSAWAHAVQVWRQYAPAGCELQDEDGRIHAAVE